jgi:hypothetical protein
MHTHTHTHTHTHIRTHTRTRTHAHTHTGSGAEEHPQHRFRHPCVCVCASRMCTPVRACHHTHHSYRHHRRHHRHLPQPLLEDGVDDAISVGPHVQQQVAVGRNGRYQKGDALLHTQTHTHTHKDRETGSYNMWVSASKYHAYITQVNNTHNSTCVHLDGEEVLEPGVSPVAPGEPTHPPQSQHHPPMMAPRMTTHPQPHATGS